MPSSSNNEGDQEMKNAVGEDTPRNRAAPDLRSSNAASFVDLEDLYRVKKLMGQGAFGCVVAGEHARSGQKVAIKKVKGCSSDRTASKRLLRELRFLRELKGHANVVNLQDVFVRYSGGQMDVYIVTDLMEADLEQIIKSPQSLSTEHVRCLTFQMLNGLRHLHRSGIVHRDLKPANLVVDSQCRLKICDMGLSRHISDNVTQTESTDAKFTDYVVTRWYRAPELLLGSRKYSSKVDLWAAGCILGELLVRKPLFPGSDTTDMLVRLCAKLSPPSTHELSALTTDSAAKSFVQSIPQRPVFSWSGKYPQADLEALSLMGALLEWTPATRLSVEEALSHPFMASLNDPANSPNAGPQEELALVSQRTLQSDRVTDLILLEACHSRASSNHSVTSSSTTFVSRACTPQCSCGSRFRTPAFLLCHLDPAFARSLPQGVKNEGKHRMEDAQQQCRVEERMAEAKIGHDKPDCRQETLGGDVMLMDSYIVM